MAYKVAYIPPTHITSSKSPGWLGEDGEVVCCFWALPFANARSDFFGLPFASERLFSGRSGGASMISDEGVR